MFYQAVDLNMDAINIGLETVKKMDESNNNYSNGRPTTLSSQHPTTTIPMSPLRLDNNNDNHFNLQSPTTLRREECNDIPTPETTPPPVSNPQPPHQEEKKPRWGLGRKKKDKK